jgi:hypothetical protein
LLTWGAEARAGAKPDSWVELRTPHFRIVSNGKEKQVLRLGLQLEQIRGALQQSFPGFRSGTPDSLVVLALKDEASMLALVSSPQARKVLELQAGVFLGARDRSCMLLRLDREDDSYHPAFHEYVHSLLALNLPHLPLWLEEGLAEFYAETRFDAHSARVGSEDRQTRPLPDRYLLSLDALRAAAPTSLLYRDPDRARVFYAESLGLVRFLIFGPGMEKGARFSRYLSRLQRGDDEDRAFAEAFGRIPQLQAGFDDFLHSFARPVLVLKDLPVADQGSFALRLLPDQEWSAIQGSLHIPERMSRSSTARTGP